MQQIELRRLGERRVRLERSGRGHREQARSFSHTPGSWNARAAIRLRTVPSDRPDQGARTAATRSAAQAAR
jgi:hypothetical protein